MAETKNQKTIESEIVEKVEKFFGNENAITCYKFSKLWGVREQMVYNYRKNRLIRVNDLGLITKDEAIKFLTKRALKKQSA